MYNKFLERYLDNDPKKSISKTGIKLRQVAYPVMRRIIPLTIKRKHIIVDRGDYPRKEPLIFVSTHEFREDAEAAYLVAGRSALFVNGSVSIVMNSFGGITNWVAGMILFSRVDKASRKAAKNKMIYALRMGASIILYPEGTWNKSPNQVISGLFSGVYDVARETGCRVVPMSHHRTEDAVYSKMGGALDISKMDRAEAMDLLKEKLATMRWELAEEYSKCKRSDLPYGEEADSYWKKHINDLMAEVPFYDYELEKHTKWVDKDVCLPSDAFRFFGGMTPSKQNAFLYRGNGRWWTVARDKASGGMRRDLHWKVLRTANLAPSPQRRT